MTVSEEEEIQIDRQYSPMQFSEDYGPVQDSALNTYVSGVGRALAGRTTARTCPTPSAWSTPPILTPMPFRAAASPAQEGFWSTWTTKPSWRPC